MGRLSRDGSSAAARIGMQSGAPEVAQKLGSIPKVSEWRRSDLGSYPAVTEVLWKYEQLYGPCS